MNELFIKSSVSFDMALLRDDLRYVLTQTDWHPIENQISLQHSKADEDHWHSGVGTNWEEVDGRWRITTLDEDVCHLNDALRGTYIEHVLTNLPFSPLRTRLMRMGPKRCYSVHRDTTARWHIALQTSAHALFVFTEAQQVYHIPDDGHAYFVDTTQPHTALNGDNRERIHMVMLDPSLSIPQAELAQYKW